MHLTVAALFWLSQATGAQPVRVAPATLVLFEAVEQVETLRDSARRVPQRLGRRFRELVEDVGFSARQTHTLALWRNTQNALYLDAYQLDKQTWERVLRARAGIREGEDRLDEATRLVNRYQRLLEAE